jgi:hypothetical protein
MKYQAYYYVVSRLETMLETLMHVTFTTVPGCSKKLVQNWSILTLTKEKKAGGVGTFSLCF